MSEADALARWVCPACALLCDDLADPEAAAAACPRAAAFVAAHDAPADPAAADAATSATAATIDGRDAGVDDAIAEAARRIAGWRQPLVAGLGTDVHGARAAFRLAARCGAIVDHADGHALAEGLRTMQDRGGYLATLAEVRTRAEVIVLVGTRAVDRFPRFFERIGATRAGSPLRRLVALGAEPPAGLAREDLSVERVDGGGDVLAAAQRLAALVAGRPRRADGADGADDSDLAGLADALRASRYSVLVWEGASLPAHGALLVETLGRIVATLNATTRAATLGLGGGDGAASAQQAFAWLGGVPLRSRIAADGLDHQPLRFAADRLVAGGGVDGVVWISANDAGRRPPDLGALPRIVLAPPTAKAAGAGPAARSIFIPVSTVGLDESGHQFRTDGPVVLPLRAARPGGLRSAADVLDAIAGALR